MKSFFVFLIIVFFASTLVGQNVFKAVVKDKATHEALQGVTVSLAND
jgi:hypothetical protein